MRKAPIAEIHVTRIFNLRVETLVLDSCLETLGALRDQGPSCSYVEDRLVLCVVLKVQECNNSWVVNIIASFGLSIYLYISDL